MDISQEDNMMKQVFIAIQKKFYFKLFIPF